MNRCNDLSGRETTDRDDERLTNDETNNTNIIIISITVHCNRSPEHFWQG